MDHLYNNKIIILKFQVFFSTFGATLDSIFIFKETDSS